MSEDKGRPPAKRMVKLEGEVKRLREINIDLEERILELYTLYNVSKSLSLSLQLEELFNVCMDLLGSLLRVERYGLLLLDEAKDDLVLQAAHGFPEGAIGARCDRGEGICGRVAENGQPEIVKELSPVSDPILSLPDRHMEGSCLCVPLKLAGGRVIGVLMAMKRDVGGLSEGDLHVFTQVAEHIAIAIEKAQIYQRAQDLTYLDSLTNLFNRRYFFERFEREVERARRYKRVLSVVMIDVDGFKSYNDTLGHLEGDVVLRRVAEILDQQLRTHDVLARLGGDEFIVLLPETTGADALQVANKLREAVVREPLSQHREWQSGRLTLSLGTATFPEHSVDPLQLINVADAAMYRAKASGGNRVCEGSV